MDGILDELLRLEDAKHHALLTLNSNVYEDSVQKQSSLVENPGLSAADSAASGKLIAFANLAGLNTTLYENLLSTAPWIDGTRGRYTGQGYLTDPPATHEFSVEG